MNKILVIGGLGLVGVAAVVIRQKLRSSYEEEAIDSAGSGSFGDRHAGAPEQRWAQAETRHDVTPEQLSTASRVETSFAAIHQVWPSLTLEELRPLETDLDRLASLIAEKTEQPRSQVRQRLDDIIARETPEPSFPAH